MMLKGGEQDQDGLTFLDEVVKLSLVRVGSKFTIHA